MAPDDIELPRLSWLDFKILCIRIPDTWPHLDALAAGSDAAKGLSVVCWPLNPASVPFVRGFRKVKVLGISL